MAIDYFRESLCEITAMNRSMIDSLFSLAEAREVVSAAALFYADARDDDMSRYIHDHRERFTHTLRRIPIAPVPGEPCLDVGGFGLTPYWLTRHSGYDVTVFNWDASSPKGCTRQIAGVDGENVCYLSVNTNLNRAWPKERQYSFVLFGETLEHLDNPEAAFLELNSVCKIGGRVLLTTPNANSLLALQHFLMGLPPWVYYSFTPDAGGTRHVFEQTPATLRELAESAGFEIIAFDTEYCYEKNGTDYSVLSKLLDAWIYIQS